MLIMIVSPHEGRSSLTRHKGASPRGISLFDKIAIHTRIQTCAELAALLLWVALLSLPGQAALAGDSGEVSPSTMSPLRSAKEASVEDVNSIARLYHAAFDRAPLEEGLNFWVHAFESGSTLTTIAPRSIGSAQASRGKNETTVPPNASYRFA